MLVDFEPDDMLYPFRSRWYDSPAGKIHYVDEGSGLPIVFFHGSPTWSFLYREIVSELRERFRCIAMDHPGFGLSARPDGYAYTISELASVAGALVDHLGLDRFVVVGHDWGGPIGLAVATRRPGRVAGIALTNTVFWPDLPLANRAFSAVMSSGVMRRRILNQNVLVERFLLGSVGPELTAAEAEHYRRVQPDAPARAGLAAMPAQIRSAAPLLADLEREIPRSLGDVPAVAIWGMRDRVFRPKDCLPRICSAFTDLDVIELPEVGHFVPEEAPGDVAEAITRRFNTVHTGR